jgi:hypothetical protein
VQVATAWTQVCVLDSLGEVKCYGQPYCAAPPSKGPYVDISTEFDHTCALKANGDVDCWYNLRQSDGGLGGDLLPYAEEYSLEDRDTRSIGELVNIDVGEDYHVPDGAPPMLCGMDAEGLVECSTQVDSYEMQRMPFGDEPVTSLSAGSTRAGAIRRDGEGAIQHYCVDMREGSPDGGGRQCEEVGAELLPEYADAVELTAENNFCVRYEDGQVECMFMGFMPGRYLTFQAAAGDVICGLVEGGEISCTGPVGAQVNESSIPSSWYPPSGSFVAFSATTFSAACAVTEDFELSCWGRGTDSLGPMQLCEYIPEPEP